MTKGVKKYIWVILFLSCFFILVVVGLIHKYYTKTDESIDKETVELFPVNDSLSNTVLYAEDNEDKVYNYADDNVEFALSDSIWGKDGDRIKLEENGVAEKDDDWNNNENTMVQFIPRESYLKDEYPFDEIEQYKLLDEIVLHPIYPENQQLKQLLDGLMPALVGNEKKVSRIIKRIYDYLILNCSYTHTTKYDYETDAVILLTDMKGSCTYYVAAMHYMLLYEGVDNRIVSGHRYPREGSNETTFHRWIEIDVGGVAYLFDPEWEDSLTISSDGIQYLRFMKTHEEMKNYYVF